MQSAQHKKFHTRLLDEHEREDTTHHTTNSDFTTVNQSLLQQDKNHIKSDMTI